MAYPESAPADWQEILAKSFLPCAISPLHDQDLNSETEEALKKPHWHILMCFAGPTSFEVVKAVTDKINATIPIAIESVKGYYRYFTHEDNPEKHQYSKSDIGHLNGFAIGDYADLTHAEKEKLKREVCDIIIGNDVTEYADLVEMLFALDDLEHLSIVMNSTIFFNGYVSSRRNRAKNVANSVAT